MRPPRTPLSVIRTVLVVSAALLSACGGDAPPSRSEKGPGADGVPRWSLDTVPLADIGGAGDEPLVHAARAVRIGETLVVADAGAPRLAFHDLAGGRVRSVGRRGRGPGELQQPTWVGALGSDSVLVWDGGARRFSVFTREGAWVRSFAPQGVSGAFPAVHGVFADGSVLMTGGMAMAAAPTTAVRRDTVPFLRIGRDGRLLRAVGRFPGPEYYSVAAGPGAGRSYRRPFGRETSAAVAGDAFWVATGDDGDLHAFAQDGGALRRVRRDAPAVRLTPSDVAAYRAELLEAVGAAEAPAWSNALDAASFPERLPPVAGLVPGVDGALWVREAQPRATVEAGLRWTVLDATGTPRGRVEVPARFSLWQVGDGWILGGYTGGDGSDRVRLYRLVRR